MEIRDMQKRSGIEALVLQLSVLAFGCGGSIGTTGGDGESDADGRCSTVEHVSASRIAQDPGAYDGRLLVVEAPVYSGVNCTDMACPPEDPCCNDCEGGYFFDVGTMRCDLIGPEGETWECSGLECSVVCSPFGQFSRTDPMVGRLLLGTFTIQTAEHCEFRTIAVCG